MLFMIEIKTMHKFTKLTITLLLLAFLEIFGILRWLDFLLRVLLAEYNRRKSLVEKQPESIGGEEKVAGTKTVACVVGYREDPSTFYASLRSYTRNQPSIMVVGIDGCVEEDHKMVYVFNEVSILLEGATK